MAWVEAWRRESRSILRGAGGAELATEKLGGLELVVAQRRGGATSDRGGAEGEAATAGPRRGGVAQKASSGSRTRWRRDVAGRRLGERERGARRLGFTLARARGLRGVG